MKQIKHLLATLVVATVIFAGCQKDTALISNNQDAQALQEEQTYEIVEFSETESSELNTRSNQHCGKIYYGKKVHFLNGKARAFVKVNRSGVTEEVGAIITESALEDLGDHAEEEEITTVLDIPQVGSTTHLKHVYMGYNPHGHPPMNIYNVPHFDIHFYNTTSAEREAITPNDPLTTIPPPAGYLPAIYIPTAPVPQMGWHWDDPTSPQFNGQPFTSTFIYGTYNGKVTFYEPMITVDYIKSTASKYFPIKQATKFGKTGYYAREYGLRKNPAKRQYEVVIRDFMMQRGL
jgi:hypothetical protein